MPFGKGKKGTQQFHKRDSRKGSRVMKDRQHDGAKRGSPGTTERHQKSRKVAERAGRGLIAMSTEQTRAYIAGAYVYRYQMPAEEEWKEHIVEMAKEIGCDARLVRSVWTVVVDTYDFDVATRALPRSGRPTKLPPTNVGLIAAAGALNNGVSPAQATHICNTYNERNGCHVTICKNTLSRSKAQ